MSKLKQGLIVLSAVFFTTVSGCVSDIGDQQYSPKHKTLDNREAYIETVDGQFELTLIRYRPDAPNKDQYEHKKALIDKACQEGGTSKVNCYQALENIAPHTVRIIVDDINEAHEVFNGFIEYGSLPANAKPAYAPAPRL